MDEYLSPIFSMETTVATKSLLSFTGERIFTNNKTELLAPDNQILVFSSRLLL